MAEFRSFERGMLVNGTTIMSVVEGVGVFQSRARRYLDDAGLHNVVADAAHWYSQQDWLDVFATIAAEVGANTLFSIGTKIPENAKFPPDIKEIEQALASIDVAYHMNHKNRNGQILFDPNRTPAMLGGIGHYRYEQTDNERKATMVCENPYPCDFDRGIIEAMAKRFKPRDSVIVLVNHDSTAPCRRKGSESCTYHVSW